MDISEKDASLIIKLTGDSWDEGFHYSGDVEFIERLIEFYPRLKEVVMTHNYSWTYTRLGNEYERID